MDSFFHFFYLKPKNQIQNRKMIKLKDQYSIEVIKKRIFEWDSAPFPMGKEGATPLKFLSLRCFSGFVLLFGCLWICHAWLFCCFNLFG